MLQSHSNQNSVVLACGQGMNQWNRTESSQINPHIYGQSIINQTEYRKKSDGEIVVFSTSGAGTPIYTHANQ